MTLAGLNVFITGGAMGIGKAFTEVLLAEGAQKVYIADYNEKVGRQTVDELERRYGEGRCSLMVVDITDASKFKETFQTAVTECGHIDVMVNNAGTFHEFDWEPVVNLNFTALVRGCELAMKHMSHKNGGRGGRIINTCSDFGIYGSSYLAIYSATKHAVRAYTTNMAEQADLELTGVQLACICPSATDTDLLRKISDKNILRPDVLDQLNAIRLCKPSRIAEGLQKLLRMDRINGALLIVERETCRFVKMEVVNLGEDWTPSQ